MSDDATVADVCGQLRQMFGDAFRAPVATHVTRWLSDPCSLGAYSYVPAHGKRVRDCRTSGWQPRDMHLCHV